MTLNVNHVNQHLLSKKKNVNAKRMRFSQKIYARNALKAARSVLMKLNAQNVVKDTFYK